MTEISAVLIALIAALHRYFLVLEMFLWQAPRTRAVFGTSAEFAAQTQVLAANQGLYHGFAGSAVGLGFVA